MRRELLRQFYLMVSVILFFKAVESVFKADSRLWVSPPGAEQEIAIPVNHNARVLMVFEYTPERLLPQVCPLGFPLSRSGFSAYPHSSLSRCV